MLESGTLKSGFLGAELQNKVAEIKVGVMIPTFARPDLVRRALLQFAVQTRRPDLVCVHQNGEGDDYRWVADDLQSLLTIDWLYRPEKMKQHLWYAHPLQHLLERGCSHFFWADHDDIFLTGHIETALAELADVDFRVSDQTGILYQGNAVFEYVRRARFTSHAPGGMSSSMAFNRDFAEALLADLLADGKEHYADCVVAKKTMPGFRCLVSQQLTTIYVSHYASVTSNKWVEKRFTGK